MSTLTSAELDSMRATVDGLLSDTLTNSRSSVTCKGWVFNTGGMVKFAGDARLAPLPEWTLTVPDGTDLRHGDIITISGKGTYFITTVHNPNSYSLTTKASALQLKDSTNTQTFFSTTNVKVMRGNTVIAASILVHLEPVDPTPYDLEQYPDQAAGLTIFDKYVVYTLQGTPDIRNRDQIIDLNDTDPFTGSNTIYYVRRVKSWNGSHLEITCERIATGPTT